MTTVINLFGPSGTGKSTTALGLAYELKLKGYKVEVVTEWIKEKIFANDLSVVKDQLYIFAKQRRKQFILQLKNILVRSIRVVIPIYYTHYGLCSL